MAIYSLVFWSYVSWLLIPQVVSYWWFFTWNLIFLSCIFDHKENGLYFRSLSSLAGWTGELVSDSLVLRSEMFRASPLCIRRVSVCLRGSRRGQCLGLPLCQLPLHFNLALLGLSWAWFPENPSAAAALIKFLDLLIIDNSGGRARTIMEIGATKPHGQFLYQQPAPPVCLLPP